LIYYQGSIPSSSDNTAKEYVALVEDYDLTANTMDTLAQDRGGRLQGILVLNSTSSGGSSNSGSSQYTFVSPDSGTPQGYGTPSGALNYGNTAYKWNSRGENILAYDWFSVPMAYITDADVSQALREEAQSGGSTTTNNAIITWDRTKWIVPTVWRGTTSPTISGIQSVYHWRGPVCGRHRVRQRVGVVAVAAPRSPYLL
jgi:Nicastrin small lobe